MPKRIGWSTLLLVVLLQHGPSLRSQEINLRIGGTVVNAFSGAPLAGVTVSISATDSSGPSSRVLTAVNGRFLFEHLSPGKYTLSALARGYSQQSFQQHGIYSTAIAVRQNLDSENIVFRLLPDASISGQVTDDLSDPVRAARIILFRETVSNARESVQPLHEVTTDDQGRFSFGRLQAGRYYVAASAQPWYAQRQRNVASLPQGLTPAMAVEVKSAMARGEIKPVIQQDTGLDVVYPLTFYPRETDSIRASTIALQPGERRTADISLHAVSPLRLKLAVPGTDFSQNPIVAPAQPTFGGQSMPMLAPITSRNNDFIEVSIPPGRVIINLGFNVDTPNGRERRNLRHEFDASRDSDLTLATNAAAASVRGLVSAPAGARVPQPASISIREIETGATLVAPLSPDGTFDFRSAVVKPGRYIVSLGNSAGFYIEGVQAVGATASSRSLEIRGAEPVQLLVQILRGAGSVEGVALSDAKPAAGVMILLVPQDSLQDPTLFRRDQSDSDGTFAIRPVPPGRYVVMAIRDGWNQEWSRPSVVQRWLSGGETVEIAPNGIHTVTLNVQ